MRTIYFECAMGAAGDMLMGALYELCQDKETFLQDMNRLIPGVTVAAQAVARQAIAGTHMRVSIHGQEEGHSHPQDHTHDSHDSHHPHTHRTIQDITAMIDRFPLPQPVLEQAKRTYALLAEAESQAHGVPVGEVHFHEVGALDAVIDVTGVCYLMHLLGAECVIASPVTVGSGTVHTAHGLLPVPTPATARLLTGVPITTGDIAAELCTPTGAALLRTFASQYGPLPDGTVRACGCGCGTKDFLRANCLRAFLLETEEAAGPNDRVTELKANLDDMTGEALGFAMEALLEAGALDVSYTPIQMKKNRPGILLTCLCRPADADRFARLLLRHTSTFGVRRTDCTRYALDVSRDTVQTAFGPITRKNGSGYGLVKCKPEYTDLAAAAQDQDCTLQEVRSAFSAASEET